MKYSGKPVWNGFKWDTMKDMRLNFLETETDGIFQKHIKVTEENIDLNGNMYIGAIAREVGMATMEYNKAKGLSYYALFHQELLLVLVSTEVIVHKMPRKDDEIVLYSWAGIEKNWMFPRRSEMYFLNGEKAASICSQWLLIDKRTRQISVEKEIMKAIPTYSYPGEPKNPKLRVKFPEMLSKKHKRIVKSEEIDFNGHVNNSYYLDWAMELVNEYHLKNHIIESVWINYAKELFEGQKVELNYEKIENTFYLRGNAEGKESFSVKIEFAFLENL